MDASESNIKIANLHASQDPFLPYTPPGKISEASSKRAGSLNYRHTSAEALRDQGEKFDVVCAMEVLEHVDQPGEFLKCLGDMVKVRPLLIKPLSIIIPIPAWWSPPALNHLPYPPLPAPDTHTRRIRSPPRDFRDTHVLQIRQTE